MEGLIFLFHFVRGNFFVAAAAAAAAAETDAFFVAACFCFINPHGRVVSRLNVLNAHGSLQRAGCICEHNRMTYEQWHAQNCNSCPYRSGKN